MRALDSVEKRTIGATPQSLQLSPSQTTKATAVAAVMARRERLQLKPSHTLRRQRFRSGTSERSTLVREVFPFVGMSHSSPLRWPWQDLDGSSRAEGARAEMLAAPSNCSLRDGRAVLSRQSILGGSLYRLRSHV